MRLFTKLTAAATLLLCGMTAQAQTVADDATPIENFTEGYYVLKTYTKGSEGYAYYNTSGSGYASRFLHARNLTAAPTDANYIWYVTKTDNGMVFYNCGGKVYLPAQNGHGGNLNVNPTLDNAAVFVAEPTTSGHFDDGNGFLIHEENYNPFSEKLKMHCNDNNASSYAMSYWEGGSYSSTNVSVMQWEFHKVTGYSLEDLTTVYGVKMEVTSGETTSTSYLALASGTDINTKAPDASGSSEMSFYYTVTGKATCTDENQTVSATNATFHFTSTSTATIDKSKVPFTLSTAESPVWYMVYFRSNKEYGMCHAAATNNNISSYTTLNSGITDAASFQGSLWAFVDDGNYGVKILNKLNGLYLTCSAGGAATLSDAGQSFIVSTNSSAGFSVKIKGAVSYLGNHAGWNGSLKCNTTVGAWTNDAAQNDGGSSWTIYAVDTDADVLSVGKTAYTAYLTAQTAAETGSSLTVATEAKIAEAKSAVEAATTVTALNAAFDLYNTPKPETGAWYRIRNMSTSNNAYVTAANIFVDKDGSLAGAYETDNTMDRTIVRAADGSASVGDFVSQLWQLETNGTDNTVKIKSANVGGYFADYTTGDLDMPVDGQYAGSYSLMAWPFSTFSGNDGKTMFQLTVNGHQMNAYQNDASTKIQSYDGHNNGIGNYWVFEKVTEVPVTISSVGYASVAFPFPVEVAEDDATIYIATQAGDGNLKLAELSSQVIPANTGVLLAHEGGATINLSIVSSNEVLSSSNILKAATAKRTGFETGNNYFLGKNSKDLPAFMKGNFATVPANKAYLPKTSINDTVEGASADALSFTLGGDTTGIATAQSESQRSAKYYDLSGRRVLFPANGIFVTDKGEKVFVK